MKRHLGVALLALNLLLVLLLVWLWVRPDGGLKNVHWVEPRAQTLNLDNLVPAMGRPTPMDQSQFLAMLDRPVFSPTRRPPPPPPPPPVQAPPPPPDYLSGATLTGAYVSADGTTGGVIIRYQNKDKSLPLRGVLDGWTLSSIAGNRVYFSRDGQTREITLQKAKLQGGPESAAQRPSAAPDFGASDPSASGQPAAPRRRGATLGGGHQ